MKAQVWITVSLLLATMACTNARKNENKTQSDPVKPDTAVVTEQTVAVVATPLNGYFLRNTYQFAGDTDYLLFPNQTAFDAVLGKAKTMGNKIDMPDFGQQIVGAITLKPVRNQTTLTLRKAEVVGGTTVDLYVESTAGEALSYTITPTLVFQFPKTAGIQAVNFYMNGIKAATVPAE